jgi:uncharacterized membrane protein
MSFSANSPWGVMQGITVIDFNNQIIDFNNQIFDFNKRQVHYIIIKNHLLLISYLFQTSSNVFEKNEKKKKKKI